MRNDPADHKKSAGFFCFTGNFVKFPVKQKHFVCGTKAHFLKMYAKADLSA